MRAQEVKLENNIKRYLLLEFNNDMIEKVYQSMVKRR